ncbi:uncharacterized protein LOC129741476 [Uranotaenia lowii]|uniref:uncharacterized protein LOC129741476 n=1 Tax=Uranotaenia lowii TaxID=190385 RepID=UPI00247B02F1|nr:uncharacterized protein LOC129741476 [Uranotaenia lowii]
MSTERRLKALKTRLRSIQTSFGLIKAFVDEYNDETHSDEVPVRLENLGVLWNDFLKVQGEIEAMDILEPKAIEAHLAQRVEFESLYYKVKGFLLAANKLPPSPNMPIGSSFTSHFPPSSHHIRLPDIKIPTFSGNIDTWLNFHDLFVSLVHSSHELSSIQKFYYLRASLSGDAQKLIQTIPISSNNYLVAWNLLLDHFQNPSRLKQSYVDSLFEFSALKSESASDLHSLVERFEANVKILHQLGERTEYWDILLIRMLSIRLDSTTRRDWEVYATTKDSVSFQDLVAFIQRRVTVLESIKAKVPETTFSGNLRKSTQRSVSSHSAYQLNDKHCAICSENHVLYHCPRFAKMSLDTKEKEIRRLHLCRNCLRKGHLANNCSSTNCRKCRGRHHTLLCSGDYHNNKSTESTKAENSLPSQQPTTSVSAILDNPVSLASTGCKKVLLATAIVNLIDDNGTIHTARALLDSGSECCFITESLSQRMKSSRVKINLPISGIGQSLSHARHKIQTTLQSRVSNFSTTLEFIVLPKVTTNLPTSCFDVSDWKIPSDINLADPAFFATNPVELILGAEIFFELLKPPGRISLGDSYPLLINSTLGWIVSGRTSNCHSTGPVMASVASVAELHRLMERFWLIEEGDSTPCHSVEEAACENHFQSTVSRTDDGRYMVRLPAKQDLLPNLGNNWNTANRRFKYLESKLSRNNDQRIQYVEFMHEYLFLGHMCEVNRAHQLDALEYFMPHHAVIRESSTTTKIRVVFDASCRSASGASLNDILMVGPVVQEDIRSIIMRARKHQIMLIGDIKQMYRQILVDPRDTPMQRIVWRSNPTSPLATFELKTVTYGTASAPFLATRVLQQLADDEQKDFPEAATILKRDFYVDDLFSGAETVEKVISLREQLDALCQRGGFELRKYASNSEAALEGLSDDKRALQPTIEFDGNPIIKTLGLHWEPASDVLKYVIELEPLSSDMCLTKRHALSLIARLFDPLGLVAPVVVTAKIYMQVLWTLRDEDSKTWPWDRPLPKDLIIRWNSYYSQLHHLNMLKIERCILVANPTSIQLHLFSDASESAYGACAYLRSVDPSGFVKIALITTKSKVAPLQKKSIARLELCGALAAAQLYQKVISSLKSNPETFFWVDSTTVLAWLNSTPSTWSTFVANRVSKIQLATINTHWNHVSGKENPADHLSRGTTAEFLLTCSSWWNGPDWLRLEPEFWPSNNHQKRLTEVAEEKRKTLSLIAAAQHEETFLDSYVQRFSDYRKMLRVTAYCMRFIDRFSLKTSFNHPTTNLTVEEIRRAERNLIRILQEQHFEEELRCLHDGKQVSSKSKLRWFHPILGIDHLLRIGGRLNKAPRTYDSKHQIILPSTHAFSTLLIRSFHLNHLHAAPQLLLSLLRMRYWVLGARNRARLIVRQCIICFKARPRLVEQFMGELPAARITATRPFAVAGIDYWGPIFLKPVHRRAASEKAFVAVFVCFSTKAVHIELVADLSTAKFIQALRRFVSRRGLCSDMHSDNGRNFLGADNELRRLVNSSSHQQAVNQECLAHGIRWHFNPPKASHFGGLWEAAIFSAQKHFIRVIGNHTLAYDDMVTLLCQIECCLNSRPITPLSDESSDLEPLTPGHFLIGSQLKAVPDNDLSDIQMNRLRKWQQTQKIFQDIWKRWHREYLCTLQARTKWCNTPVEIKPGQLVLLKDEGKIPMHWPTARITEIHPGDDGITRVVSVRSSSKVYTRPVTKICVLPFSSQPTPTEAPEKSNKSGEGQSDIQGTTVPVCSKI